MRKDPAVLAQLDRDQKIVEMMPDILKDLTPESDSYDEKELRKILSQKKCPEMFEDAKRILDFQHDIHFDKTKRNRTHGRSR